MPAPGDAPFPLLQLHPTSGLSFEWSEFISRSGSTFDASFGHDGVGLGLVMLVRYRDMETAIKELIGYSERDPDPAAAHDRRLVRHLPFQHPRWPQFWCEKITKVQGVRFVGKDEENLRFTLDSGQVGGPVSEYKFLMVTLSFGRPPYAVLGDDDPLLYQDGVRQEWRRYTDRHWQGQVQVLNREGMAFEFSSSPPTSASGNQFPGSVGERLQKVKLSRTWYQIPEKGLYTVDGFPKKLFTGAEVTLSGVANNGSGYCRVTTASAHGFLLGQTVLIRGVTGTTRANGTSVITNVGSATQFDTDHAFDAAYSGGPGTATSFNPGSLNIADFMGMPAQTLLYEMPEIVIRPLPIPPQLMGIVGEEVQLQYDVKFNFEYFDPPLGAGATVRGHNNMPFAGDGLWYPVQSIGYNDGTYTLPPRKPFPLTDYATLFEVM